MILFNSIPIAQGVPELINQLKDEIETRVNIRNTTQNKQVSISQNMLFRVSFIAGLTQTDSRVAGDIVELKLTANGTIHDTVFQRNNLQPLWSALIKLRYRGVAIDIENATNIRKIINYEVKRGAILLLKDSNLDDWLHAEVAVGRSRSFNTIPTLRLQVGTYEDDLDAYLDMNSSGITNTQVLVAGTTGSGKSNLLAVLLQELRSLSVETNFPVNFMFFDYKGEFSDPANNDWLNHFEVNRSCIYDPIKHPLPINPFKDFTGKTQNEINLYSNELANAIISIDAARMSANMSNRLSEAIINAYKATKNLPISFEAVLKQYTALQPDKDKDKDDSIKSVLKQLIRSNLFTNVDSIDLVKNSCIIKMDGFPKEGPIAKAIVYFLVSKLNMLYEDLPKQNINEDLVELRHFTIIDEAHYMLDFDNRPLRNLIAVGRNKGLSIILATQNMESYKSDHFDFYANAQYPLIMKQQSINDQVIKDLFGVAGKELQEVREAIAGLQKGELIIKNPTAIALGMGKKFKKIRVRHLI